MAWTATLTNVVGWRAALTATLQSGTGTGTDTASADVYVIPAGSELTFFETSPAEPAAPIDWDKYHGRTRREVVRRPIEQIVAEKESAFLKLMIDGHRRG